MRACQPLPVDLKRYDIPNLTHLAQAASVLSDIAVDTVAISFRAASIAALNAPKVIFDPSLCATLCRLDTALP